MSRSVSPFSSRRLAAVVLILAACTLAGCGRKGPLDLPPGASAADQGGYAPQPGAGSQQSQSANSSVLGSSSSNPGNQIMAPRGPNKRIPLDALLD